MPVGTGAVTGGFTTGGVTPGACTTGGGAAGAGDAGAEAAGAVFTGAGAAGVTVGDVVAAVVFTGAGAAGVVAAGTDSGAVVGVMVTPVTFPVIAAFCFLLVVPRASRVAFALAAAAAMAAAVRGVRVFFGAIAKAVRVVVLLLNIAAMTSLMALTAGPFWATAFSSAIRASFHALFAVEVAETASSTDETNVTACEAVYV